MNLAGILGKFHQEQVNPVIFQGQAGSKEIDELQSRDRERVEIP